MFAEWDRGWYGESPQKSPAKFRKFPDLCRMAGEGVSNLEPNHMQIHYRTLGIYVMLFEFWSIGNHPTFPRKNITWLVVWSIFYFSMYWECHHPNWRSHIFQRGSYTTNQNMYRSQAHRKESKVGNLEYPETTCRSVLGLYMGDLPMTN